MKVWGFVLEISFLVQLLLLVFCSSAETSVGLVASFSSFSHGVLGERECMSIKSYLPRSGGVIM
ncbi:hypothetical protein GLYMA_12G197233v4 [Glycine max]|nr:hypothetical protein GLYMA_12G197233v4 [Glycine max]KAH1144026.1 hypothetical protein GYH30_034301 [Glycine max]